MWRALGRSRSRDASRITKRTTERIAKRVTERVTGAEGAWWLRRSSKSFRPATGGLGGFDSHTLPPPVHAGAGRAGRQYGGLRPTPVVRWARPRTAAGQ